ncbi:MAG: peptide chain release factor N(5)-glutamine methyltransferase [Muribaculaceae bacterium]|nr:peptide chain release factor N(5)-glutamine methyltransferase [Muribaculaceae bacterium]
MTTLSEYYKGLRSSLAQVLPKGEADSAAAILMEDIGGYTRTTLFADGDREISDFVKGRIDSAVARIVGGEPVQYAVGRALFMGNSYIVTPAVLIPRPETAALVDMITDHADGRSDLRILDIGTGTGCIAISLARALPFADVDATDISAQALDVARENARNLKTKVTFRQEDILNAAPPAAPCYDIIVSNPPYIAESEKADMDARVLDYEPSTALFVPDDDPLRFYRAIAEYALKALVSDGNLYFEINSNYGPQMKEMLADKGFADIEISRDFRGNIRYASARRP